MTTTDPGSDDWLAEAGAGSEMGRKVAAFDWSSTPLGPPSAWSPALRAAASIVLASRFPMMLAWGPDLIKIYNDGYRPMLGTKKEVGALGARTRDVWPEVWSEVGPMFDEVVTTGRPTWTEDLPLVIDRNGYLEECFFTYSYSAIREADGTVGGVLDVVAETTAQVITRRRLACLTDLATSLVDASHVTEVFLRTSATMADWTDVVRGVDLYLQTDDELVMVASNRRGPVPDVAPELLARAVTDRELVVVGPAPADGTPRPVDAVVVPIGGGPAADDAETGSVGALVARLHELRPFDDDYHDFLELVAHTIGAALINAHRREVEIGAYRRISDTLQAAMLKPASDFVTVTARYVPAAGNLAVGGDWYDVIQLPGQRRALVVGDCVGHGLDAAAAMSQLRSASRAMLLQDFDPAATLSGLDHYAESIEGAFCATSLVVIVEHDHGVIRYSSAGHPPAYLAKGAGGGVWLDGGGGLPLAVDPERPRANEVLPFEKGDLLVMYSDGLVERRGEMLDEGLDRLAGAMREAMDLPLQDAADHLLFTMLPDRAADDVVLVLKCL